MLEWQKHGKPVDVENTKRGSVPLYLKLSAMPVSSRYLLSYVSKDTRGILKVGQTFTTESVTNSHKGYVASIGNLDLNYGLYPVRFALSQDLQDSSHQGIIPIKLKVRSINNALYVGNEAVFEEGKKSFVWKVDEDHMVRRSEVDIHTANESVTIIRKGLKFADMVVVHGKNILEDGDKVRIHNCQNCNINNARVTK